LLGVGGNMLIAAPLVGFAVERLKSWPRLIVYAGIVASVILPIGLRYETWTTALINGIGTASFVLFLALFAQMRSNEQQARRRAEGLMADLEHANQKLGAYAAQAEELAMTQERNRLAREIHDNLGHYLTVVNVQIEAAKTVMDSDPARALEAMDKAQDLTRKGLARVRQSVAALRESPVRNRPLYDAVASLVKETQSAGIVTEFQVNGKPQDLDHKVALALYRAAQEGLTNVSRHARASRIDVLLEYRQAEVCLVLKDNGLGAADYEGGFGLLGIRERMQLVGGRLKIETGVGEGFCLTACAPLSFEGRPSQPQI
jgi:signal transduction histidine kinase